MGEKTLDQSDSLASNNITITMFYCTGVEQTETLAKKNPATFFVRPQETTLQWADLYWAKTCTIKTGKSSCLKEYTISLKNKGTRKEEYRVTYSEKIILPTLQEDLLRKVELKPRSSVTDHLYSSLWKRLHFHLNKRTVSQLRARCHREVELVYYLFLLYCGLHWSQ